MQIVVIVKDGADVEAILLASCTTCLRGWKYGNGNYRCIVMVCNLFTGQSVRMDKYHVMEACGARIDLSTILVQVLTALPLLSIG